ncbi:2766_t:CDS:2 [Entrophospora sp. SA101]|nr:2766_t:CDS:2 [Entrophospora sp. SA101]
MVYKIPTIVEDKISLDAKKLIEILDNFVELKQKAKSLGLWNLFLSKDYRQHQNGNRGLTTLEYAIMAEIMGKSIRIAPEATNCSPPDTGNMEVFAKYGTPNQKEKWLKPLLNGEIRSAFAMTEKAMASSDATNIQTSIKRVGNEYVINGHKWWISGAGDPRCAVYLVMGKSDFSSSDTKNNRHQQHSLVIVPANTPGIKIIRPMTVFGYDDAPEGHCEIVFTDVRVPVENIMLGEGRGFEIIQGRLGPGRIHHCMRSIGMAERGLELMLLRVTDPSRRTFGKLLAEHGTIVSDIANARMAERGLELMLLRVTDPSRRTFGKLLAEHGTIVSDIANAHWHGKGKKNNDSFLDLSIQAHGAAGLSVDFPLAYMYAIGRTLRIADGPDEVHIQQIGKLELRRSLEIKKFYEDRPKYNNNSDPMLSKL